MTIDWFIAVTTFALVSCWTPGPNNTFLMASGLTHGFVRTLPAIFGVSIGFAVMVLGVAFGVSKLFQAVPVLYEILKVGSVLYLLYLAWRIASSDPRMVGKSGARPVTFLEAVGFQWINPKGWTMALVSSAAYVVAESPTVSVFVIGAIFLVSGLSSSSSWAAGGTALRALIGNPAALRAINIVLALLLVASLWPVARDWLAA
jgi:threonine/homoserine/homoserine lactone efflux protein